MAIIFNGGDSSVGSPLDLAFKRSNAELQKLFKIGGFDKVIVLSPDGTENQKPTAQNLIKTIGDLKNTGELQIGFIAHGNGIAQVAQPKFLSGAPQSENTHGNLKNVDQNLKAGQNDFARRFTPINLTSTEREMFNEQNSSNYNFSQIRFSISSTGATTETSHFNDVGMGEFKNAIESAQQKNPGLKTTISTTACFSGGLARSLAEMKDVQTFVASQAPVFAWYIGLPETEKGDQNEPSSYFDYLTSELGKGKSYLDAHDEAVKKYFEKTKLYTAENQSLNLKLYSATPRNGLQEHIINWCIRFRNNRSHSFANSQCQMQNVLRRVNTTNSISSIFFKENSEIKRCNQNAAVIAEIKTRQNKITERALNQAIEKIKSAKDYRKLYSNLVERTENAYAQLKENKYPDLKSIKNFLEDLKKKNPTERFAYIQELQEANSEMILNTASACLKGLPNVNVLKCDLPSIANLAISQLNIWDPAPPSSQRAKFEALRKVCKISKNLTPDEITKRLDCLISLGDKNPEISLLIASQIKPFGTACNLYFAAARAAEDDVRCAEDYQKFASCEDWSRLKNLYLMGSQTLLGPINSGPPILRQLNQETLVK